VAETLLASVERVYRNGVVIAITSEDIYMATKSFRFVFSVRDQRAAVVSTARMDPRFYGLPADGELWTSRIKKMVTKNIGTLVFRRRESADPRSVLYGSILSFDDLDFMTEAFSPGVSRADRRAWLERADAACTKARTDLAALAATPIRTTNEALAALAQVIKLDNGLLSAISSRKPARGDAQLVRKLRSAFAQAIAADQAALDALTARGIRNDSGKGPGSVTSPALGSRRQRLGWDRSPAPSTLPGEITSDPRAVPSSQVT
jgi:hypothetical protein